LRKRTRARKIVMDVLYHLEIEECSVEGALHPYVEELESAGIKEFVDSEIEGIITHKKELDKMLDESAEGWSISRMPVLDRNILRIGLYEILYDRDIPDSVSINEAVEMANMYSTEDSGRFVNGILGRLVKDLNKTVGG